MTDFIRIIDCETTGTTDDDQVVEIGSVDLKDRELANAMSTLVQPTIPIPPVACAVHHITDDMVAGAPSIEEAMAPYMDARVFAAHNCAFDRRFLPFEGDWICTYKAAMTVWPDAPEHKNQVLRYWLGLPALPDWVGINPHRALFDAWTTAMLLQRLLDQRSVEELVEISGKPLLLPFLRFGKHANVPMREVPKDYLEWILREDFDEDVMHTARHWVDRVG